jgi:hypothetical protein
LQRARSQLVFAAKYALTSECIDWLNRYWQTAHPKALPPSTLKIHPWLRPGGAFFDPGCEGFTYEDIGPHMGPELYFSTVYCASAYMLAIMYDVPEILHDFGGVCLDWEFGNGEALDTLQVDDLLFTKAGVSFRARNLLSKPEHYRVVLHRVPDGEYRVAVGDTVLTSSVAAETLRAGFTLPWAGNGENVISISALKASE